MRRRLIHVAVSVCVSCTTGCASIVHGSKQEVTITSEPAGARVSVLSMQDGSPRVRANPGVTPLQVKLTRRDPHMVIRFEKDGCAPVEIPVKRSVSGWTFANLVFVNPAAGQGADSPEAADTMFVMQLLTAGVGFLIDQGTGGAFKLPTWLHATLCTPTETPQCANGCSVRVPPSN